MPGNRQLGCSVTAGSLNQDRWIRALLACIHWSRARNSISRTIIHGPIPAIHPFPGLPRDKFILRSPPMPTLNRSPSVHALIVGYIYRPDQIGNDVIYHRNYIHVTVPIPTLLCLLISYSFLRVKTVLLFRGRIRKSKQRLYTTSNIVKSLYK